MILYCPGRWFIAQPCEQIADFRNRIIHEYAELDSEVVWAIVQNEVSKTESLLEESGYGG